MDRMIEEVHGEHAVANAMKRDEEGGKKSRHKEDIEKNQKTQTTNQGRQPNCDLITACSISDGISASLLSDSCS